MSQHDLVVDNGPGINVRLDLNQAIQALGSMELGTVAPVPTYACQRWADQTTGLMKKRNTANTAWLVDGKLDVATAGGVPVGGAAGQMLVKNSAADGDMVWSGGTGFLPITGGTIAGNLGVTGTLAVTGTISTASPPQCNVPAGQSAIYYGNVAGARQWYWGVLPTGAFAVVDASGGVQRLGITTAGNATFANSLTVSGNFATNQINGTVIAASSNIQCNPGSGAAWFYATAPGVRQWLWGANTDGGFYVIDGSAGNITRLRIDTAGTLTVSGNLAVSGSFTIGALNCSSISNSGPSTLVGTVSCNAISCATINTNNNVITCGLINANGRVQVVDGINYSNLGAHTIGFNNSGATLTFFALGGTTASWTFSVSDERFKKNIGPATGDALAEIERLALISFDIPSEDEEQPTRHYNRGFSAQNVKSITPESVTKITLPDGREQLVLDTLSLIARCVGAIQQLSSRIKTLEGRATQ